MCSELPSQNVKSNRLIRDDTFSFMEFLFKRSIFLTKVQKRRESSSLISMDTYETTLHAEAFSPILCQTMLIIIKYHPWLYCDIIVKPDTGLAPLAIRQTRVNISKCRGNQSLEYLYETKCVLHQQTSYSEKSLQTLSIKTLSCICLLSNSNENLIFNLYILQKEDFNSKP